MGSPARFSEIGEDGAQGRNRTADTVIFSHVLYQLSYLGTEALGGAPIEAASTNCPARCDPNLPHRCQLGGRGCDSPPKATGSGRGRGSLDSIKVGAPVWLACRNRDRRIDLGVARLACPADMARPLSARKATEAPTRRASISIQSGRAAMRSITFGWA